MSFSGFQRHEANTKFRSGIFPGMQVTFAKDRGFREGFTIEELGVSSLKKPDCKLQRNVRHGFTLDLNPQHSDVHIRETLAWADERSNRLVTFSVSIPKGHYEVIRHDDLDLHGNKSTTFYIELRITNPSWRFNVRFGSESTDVIELARNFSFLYNNQDNVADTKYLQWVCPRYEIKNSEEWCNFDPELVRRVLQNGTVTARSNSSRSASNSSCDLDAENFPPPSSAAFAEALQELIDTAKLNALAAGNIARPSGLALSSTLAFRNRDV